MDQFFNERRYGRWSCKYNHPQRNGKMEKWFETYNRYRDDFDGIDDPETPEQAFYKEI